MRHITYSVTYRPVPSRCTVDTYQYSHATQLIQPAQSITHLYNVRLNRAKRAADTTAVPTSAVLPRISPPSLPPLAISYTPHTRSTPRSCLRLTTGTSSTPRVRSS